MYSIPSTMREIGFPPAMSLKENVQTNNQGDLIQHLLDSKAPNYMQLCHFIHGTGIKKPAWDEKATMQCSHSEQQGATAWRLHTVSHLMKSWHCKSSWRALATSVSLSRVRVPTVRWSLAGFWKMLWSTPRSFRNTVKLLWTHYCRRPGHRQRG